MEEEALQSSQQQDQPTITTPAPTSSLSLPHDSPSNHDSKQVDPPAQQNPSTETQTLVLDDPDPPIPRQESVVSVDEQDPEDQEGMTLSPSHQPLVSDTRGPSSSVRRLPNSRRKRGSAKNNPRKIAAIEKKVQTLTQKWKAIPFVPAKSLDFSRFEEQLKRLGLWDFAHLEFDKRLRTDLLAKLIVGYNKQKRCSYVDNVRIMVNQTDLARALSLPRKKTSDREEAWSADFVSFVSDFVSNWMLLHEDSWMLSKKVVDLTKWIREGHPEKVDWAQLIWCMVETELTAGTDLGDCYYASHLQHLIKVQKGELLKENNEEVQEIMVVRDDDEEEESNVKMEEDELSHGGEPESSNVKMEEDELSHGGEPESSNVKMEEDELSHGGEPESSNVKMEEDELSHGGEPELNAENTQVHVGQEASVGIGGVQCKVSVEIVDNVGDLGNTGQDEKSDSVSNGDAVKQDQVNNPETDDQVKSMKIADQPDHVENLETSDQVNNQEAADQPNLVKTPETCDQVDNLKTADQPDQVKNLETCDEVKNLETADQPDQVKNLELSDQVENLEAADHPNHVENLEVGDRLEILKTAGDNAANLKTSGDHVENEDSAGVQVGNLECDGGCVEKRLDTDGVHVVLGEHMIISGDRIVRFEQAGNLVGDINIIDDVGNAQIQGTTGNDMMDFEDCKAEEQGRWDMSGKDVEQEHFLRPCTMSGVEVHEEQTMQEDRAEEVEDDEAEDDEHLGDFDTLQKCNSFNLSSGNLLQAMEQSGNPYAPDFGDQSHMMLGGPSIFGNAVKREIDHESDISHRSLNDNHKRMRIEGPSWEHKPADVVTCMDQVEQWLAKARMAQASSQEETMNQNQLFMSELANKDHVIQQLRLNIEELQKRKQAELTRYDNELCAMHSLIGGYRRALKSTQQEFAEYRKRFLLPVEPLYKDAGDGGVVKSTMDLEKERLKREEEERLACNMFIESMEKIAGTWETTYAGQMERVEMYSAKLSDVERDAKVLKESMQKRKVLRTAD